MDNLVIVGTSGVGKTFLERELDKLGLYSQIPMYTNRQPRKEDGNGIVCLSDEDFKKNIKYFSYCLEYCDHVYGWKKVDMEKNPISLDLTLEDLEDFMKKFPNFLPVLLEITLDDLPMLVKRMEKRGDSPEIIRIRLNKTRDELKNMDKYRKDVRKYKGLIFQIKGDKTIFEEVIPELVKMREPSKN